MFFGVATTGPSFTHKSYWSAVFMWSVRSKSHAARMFLNFHSDPDGSPERNTPVMVQEIKWSLSLLKLI